MSSDNTKINWLTGILSGWGIKECWAKILAGAIIGALSAAGLLCTSACSTTYSQTADGATKFSNRIILPLRGMDGK